MPIQKSMFQFWKIMFYILKNILHKEKENCIFPKSTSTKTYVRISTQIMFSFNSNYRMPKTQGSILEWGIKKKKWK